MCVDRRTGCPLTAVLLVVTLLPLVVPSTAPSQETARQPLRAGMIGLDTSHVPAFAKLFNEIFAFMQAADESKRQGGKPVSLKEVLAKARAEAASKL